MSKYESQKKSLYANDVVLTSVRRRFSVMDVVWMSKRCRVLTGSDIRFDLNCILTIDTIF